MKMYVLNRITYGDFDIRQSEAVAVSTSKEILQIAAEEMNSRRSYEEIKSELHYEVQPNAVRVI